MHAVLDARGIAVRPTKVDVLREKRHDKVVLTFLRRSPNIRSKTNLRNLDGLGVRYTYSNRC